MSQDSLTELEEGIDSDTLESINETFEAEDSYNDYIEREREKRRKEQERKRRAQLKKAKEKQEQQIKQYKESSEESLNTELDEDRIDIDTKITDYTARIHKIEKLTHRDIFRIHLKERDNLISTQRVKIGLPEDESNEWVRLCNWFNVDPSKPTEMRGEIVPIKIRNEDVEIDFPPIDAGLNPYKYKFKRSLNKFSKKQKVRKAGVYIDKSAPLWGTLLGTILGLGILFVGVYLNQFSNILFQILGTLTGVIGAGIFSISFVWGLYYWGGGLLVIGLMSLSSFARHSSPYLKKMYRFAFPK